MNRLALTVARAGAHIPPISATVPLSRAIPAATALPIVVPRTYATSAPKSAEGPSAQSGGARSKDAAEEANAKAEEANEGPAENESPSTPSEQVGSEQPALGRTGGGEPLDASENPPPRPKVYNSAVPGSGKDPKLSPEQQEEVDRHNKDFEKRFDRAESAQDDKVDKKFWAGSGGRDVK